jgi:hypothetical protein
MCSKRGGGVITYVRDDLPITLDGELSNNFCESTMCFVPTLKLALITIYRPPSCPSDKFYEVIDNVRTWLEAFEKDGQLLPSIIITGDFNFPSMNFWDQSDISGLRSRVGIQSQD